MQLQRVHNLTQPELEKTVYLHSEMLKESFLNNFGKNFLRTIYKEIPKNRENIFITLIEKGALIGYTVATKNSSNFTSQVIKNNFFSLAWDILKSSVKNPSILLRLSGWLLTSRPKEKYPAELLFIAIEKNSQIKGYGTKLINELYNQLGKEGIQHLRVGTKANNPASNAFYKKLSFNFLQTKQIFGDQFNYYLSPRIS